MVVDGDNLAKKPWEELQRVQQFLGLDWDFTRGDFKRTTKDNIGEYCYRYVLISNAPKYLCLN